MATTQTFDLERRERLLALLAVGKSVEEAAAEVGISRPTIARWAARGRVPDATTEHERFARRLDAIRSGEAEDVLQGEAKAAETAEGELPATHPYRWALEGDPFVVGSPDELALLTPEQREHVMAMAKARARRGRQRSERTEPRA
jgi:hypothetical protein